MIDGTPHSPGTEPVSHIHAVPDLPYFKVYSWEARRINYGEYRLLQGTDDPIQPVEGQLHVLSGEPPYGDILPGVHQIGMYKEMGLAHPFHHSDPVVSFLYHKANSEGQLETTERAIVLRGIGYGIHPGHAGQEPSWYLVGPQIGTVDPATRQVSGLPAEGAEVAAKHFSVACIEGGPFGEPVLANPVQ